MLKREDWLPLARKLDWEFSYVSEREVFPEEVSGSPWLEHAAWQGWDEPYRTSYREYVRVQHQKEVRLAAAREAIGRVEDVSKLDRGWLSVVKLHAATLALAEFAAVVGNLRAARFGRDSAWRIAATFGALDELRHTQIPLLLLHDLVQWDVQFDWTHKFFHTNNWVAIAARHLVDELLLTADPIEFAVATHFVFETGFTNLQFVRGDTVGLLVLVHDTDTIAELARVLVAAAAVRLAPAPRSRVYRGGIELNPEHTVARAGLTALERVDLVPEWPEAEPPALPSGPGAQP